MNLVANFGGGMKAKMRAKMGTAVGGCDLTVTVMGACLWGALGYTSGASAQESQSLSLEEVVVTAQKRSENLQDVPISVAAFTEEQIRERGLSRPMDVGYQVPGLVAKSANGDNSPLFTIRGVGLSDFTVGNNSPTSTYIDQVVKPYYPLVNFSLFNVERVEVLKGPQGTLYGRNNTGGALKFMTRQPSDTPDGFMRVDYGNFATFEGEGALGGPVTDTLSVRVAGFTRQREKGWQYNTVTADDNGEIDRRAGRIAARWEPSEVFAGTLSIYAGRNRSDVPQFKLAPPFDAANRSQVCAAALAGIRARDGSCVDSTGHFDSDSNNHHIQTANIQGEGIREDGEGAVLTLDWSLPAFDVTSVTGYDQQERQEFQDFDATPVQGTDNLFKQDIQAFSQELRASSKESGWIAGLFYSKDEVDNLQVMRGEDLFAQPAPFVTTVDWVMQTESYAAFGQLERPLSDRFTGILGARYSHEERTFEGGTVPLHTVFPLVVVDNETSVDDVSGKVGLNFKASDDVLLYVSASKGFKSGGFGGGFATRAVAYAPYGPEELFAYEAGIKSQPLDTLRLNAAAYFYNWKDFQATVTRVDPLTNLPTQVLNNAGDAHIKGVEAELNWRPAAGLDIALSGNWTDADIVRGIYKGRTIGNTPEFSGAGSMRYEHSLGSSGGSVFALTDFNYRTRYPLRLVTATTRPLVYQDAFWLANARVGYRSASEKVTVSAWVRNVFDEEYLLEVFDQGSLNTLDLYAEPRTYGISVTYNFF